MMKNLYRSLFTFAAAALISAGPALAAEGWTEDFEGAKETAVAENKDILLEFTGSDWCPPCKELNRTVFSQDTFKQQAPKSFVLLKLDFPRKKQQSADQKAHNRELADTYGVRGYPTIILADAQGRAYAETGYRPGGAEAYIKHLEELKQVRVKRDEHMAMAEKAQGLEKAKALHAAMQEMGDDLAVKHYESTVNQIIELDADNKAGLKKHYEDVMTAIKTRAEMQKIMRSSRGNAQSAIDKLDEILKRANLTKEIQQEIHYNKSTLR